VIPLYDIHRTRRRPVMTYLLFALNLGLFAYVARLPELVAEELVLRYGLVPSVITGGGWLVPRTHGGALGALVTPFTSMFLHGSALHVAGNLLFLHVFGDNVEDTFGRLRFVLFYVACGLGAALAQVAIDPHSVTPMIGASGAISGVLAAYVVLFPGARVVTLSPFFLLIELPAVGFIALWFVIQVLSGLGSLWGSSAGGVAWFAHLGGFGVGYLIVKRWLRDHDRPSLPPPGVDHALG
jgi:membrane associated rhomboid family serine protease